MKQIMQYCLSTLFLVFFVVAASLAVFGAWGIWFGGVLCIAALTLHCTRDLFPNGVRNCSLIVFFGIILPLIIQLLPDLSTPREVIRHAGCTSNLKGIGLALHNYHDAHKHFPPIFVCDKKGKPLRSWLAEILPEMGMTTVFAQLNKDEPWNSAHNARILAGAVGEWTCPSANRNSQDVSSNYLAIIGPNTIWKSDGPKSILDLPNGTTHSIIAVEAVGTGKHWAEPFGITVDEVLENMRKGEGVRISTCHPSRINVLFADCSVLSFPAKMPLSYWRKLLNGELTNFVDLEDRIDPDAPDNVSVSLTPVTRWRGMWAAAVGIVVWLISAIWLFYRVVKSRSRESGAKAEGEGVTNAR
jgi:prepilin-type processing-associated H-X9-DG protein